MDEGLTASRLLLNRQMFGALLAAGFAAFRVWPVAILLAVLVVVSALCALVDALREPSKVKAAEVVAIALVLAPMLLFGSRRSRLSRQVNDPKQFMVALLVTMLAVWVVVWPHPGLRRFARRLGKVLGIG